MYKIYNKTIRPMFINGQTIQPKCYSQPMFLNTNELKNLDKLKNDNKILLQEVVESQPLVVNEEIKSDTNDITKTTKRRTRNSDK